tara:strand:- start:34754 stop:38284 length:3531 start_codon:yes stop_codon:yes gene_type:complete
MRLKSIKLAGFKSFVDATTVMFSSNMTAIVGPNGCGKSNIIDAVRWVMGESSAKNLRGESMTDVIFNGATGRQPVGQASIELLFDNSEGRLNGEYAAFSEISIRRKVTREGISQYYLNGSKCRRRDVTDIFLGTGMGPRSYAIIEQGMISKLIESKPEDLRVYLEEAAGISKYKERRRETENRMKRTQDNLDRLADIRDELGKQLQHLKRQATAAERYAEYKKEQRLNTAKLNALHWQNLSVDFEQKQALIHEHELIIEDSVLAKNTNENLIDSLKTQLEEGQANFNSVQAKYYQSGAEIATLEQQLQFQKNRLQEQLSSIQRLEQELASLSLTVSDEKERLENINIECEDIVIELEEAEAAAESLSFNLEMKSHELESWQESWEQFNQKNASAHQSVEVSQSKIQEHESRIRELSLKHEKLLAEQDILNAQMNEIDMSTLQEASLILSEQLELDCDNIANIEPLIRSGSSEIDALKRQKNEVYKELTEQKAILASLNTLQQGVLGDHPEKVDEWCSNNGYPKPSRMLNSIKASPGWEQAVEQVLADWLDAVVLKDDTISAAGTDFFQKVAGSKLSISFIESHNSDSGSEKTPTEGRLSKLVAGAEGLLPQLNSIYAVENLSEGLLIRKKIKASESIITKDGYWFGQAWFKYYFPQEQQSGLLVRAKKIHDLELGIEKQETLFHQLSNKIEIALGELSELNERYDALKQEISLKEVELRKLEQAITAGLAKHEQFLARLGRNQEDLLEVSTQKEDITLSLEEIRALWQESMDQLESFSGERESLQNQKEQLISSLDEVRRQSKEAQNRAHQLQLSRQQKVSQKMLVNQTIQRFSLELEQGQAKIKALSGSDTVDEEMIENLSLQLEGLLEIRLLNEGKLNSVRSKVEELNALLKEEEFKRHHFESHISSAREALTSFRMDAHAISINQKNILDKIISDDYTLNNIIEQLSNLDTENILTDSLSRLETKISRLGSINLAAIEEYQIQSERKEHLDEQNEDLMDALDTLMTAIKKIDKETRIRFKETYDQVNEGLQRLFPKIFGGGNAYLELTDDNLLETGVQIIARPPGKKNATIHLLSGGEKSLTAIALIFAIFELNPAPFCMLDEVDAPLDDANVGRFAHIVKEMSSQVQFIYISHNKVSMERADQLMGVTMHEPGVSRLVSVDIEQAAAMVDSI